MFSGNDYNPSKVRYTEKANMKSPTKFDSMSGANLGGSGFLSLPGGPKDLKQTRSVSRGRPSTASNNLVNKVNNASPAGHKK